MTVGAEVVLDTNILIYAATGRVDAEDKFEISRGLLTSEFGVSAQILAEFYHNVTRKGVTPLTTDVAAEWVNLLLEKPNVAVDAAVVKQGIALSKKYQISYWDGAVIAAAIKLGARTLYSEDLNHEQMYETVKVINPFITPPEFQ